MWQCIRQDRCAGLPNRDIVKSSVLPARTTAFPVRIVHTSNTCLHMIHTSQLKPGFHRIVAGGEISFFGLTHAPSTIVHLESVGVCDFSFPPHLTMVKYQNAMILKILHQVE